MSILCWSVTSAALCRNREKMERSVDNKVIKYDLTKSEKNVCCICWQGRCINHRTNEKMTSIDTLNSPVLSAFLSVACLTFNTVHTTAFLTQYGTYSTWQIVNIAHTYGHLAYCQRNFLMFDGVLKTVTFKFLTALIPSEAQSEVGS